MAFGAMVRNFDGLDGEGDKRIFRGERKGRIREFTDEYSLLRRDDGSTAWVFPDRFDMIPDTVFCQSQFIPRLDFKLENGFATNALGSALTFSCLTTAKHPRLHPDVGIRTYPSPFLDCWAKRRRELSTPIPYEWRYGGGLHGQCSWISSPRCNSRIFERCATPTENTHRLIRSKLAIRGGGRSWVRIALGDAHVYISALRGGIVSAMVLKIPDPDPNGGRR